MYLNSQDGYNNFMESVADDIYVDKSMIINIISSRINKRSKYLCITRPRRFGKSEITYLLESYYSRAVNSKEIFDTLAISDTPNYQTHLNKYNVIKIDFSNVDTTANTYDGYIGRITKFLSRDLETTYKDIDLTDITEVADKLNIINQITGEKFIFILDEWDFIFNKNLYAGEQEKFLEFLRNLLKGRSYVSLCYMTGILPIKKHSTGSELNMFSEFSFFKDKTFDTLYGFTEKEVKKLCETNFNISYNEMAYWYNGYTTASGNKIFNPRSVVEALSNNDCQSYWTNVGALNEVVEYLKLDTTGVIEDVIKMINSESIPILIKREFRAGSKIPQNREEIYSAMITWGFLSYSNDEVRIPNNELMIEFELALTEDCFGDVAQIISNSNDMLVATLNQDSDRVAQIIHDIHNCEIPILKYTDENSTSCVLTLAYLSARNKYRIEREEKSGKGFVDFVFHPKNNLDIPIIVELKRNSNTQVALNQILEREYAKKYIKQYQKDILIVAINYSDKNKTHSCEIQKIKYER
ncbi:MAG: AAA family ATPase [Epulopiscium sp. Nele67-Bin004]|nr:MAG: AAA family ATPase [Epulopiscium sp. Nele67-Bin004]